MIPLGRTRPDLRRGTAHRHDARWKAAMTATTATAARPAADVAEIARRRRGAALEDAIRQAAFDELSEVGYATFSVESVAERARTGKASIYRRWPTKQALVL